MADILNLPECGGITSIFNSGEPFCDFVRRIAKHLFFADKGVSFTPADRATRASFIAAMKVKTRNPRGNRIYPVFDLSNFEDKTKEATRGTVGNLSLTDIILQDAIPSFAFQHYKGEIFHKMLYAAQNANLEVFFLDSAYVLYGTALGQGNIKGFSLSELYVETPKFATASETAKYPFSITLANLSEFKENAASIQLDSTALSVKGNVDVQLEKVSQAANVINIAVTGRGGKNMGDLFSTELAAIGAWKITNTQTGAVVTVTSVTYNSSLGYYVVTADTTAYTNLTTGQKMNVDLVATAALTVLGVDGFESLGFVQIVKP